jgi:hypothetical protein
MNDDHAKVHRDWRIPDELWERLEPLLPSRKPHPLGCIAPVSRIARRWMPASSCGALAAHGTPCMTRASVPAVPPIAASRRGQRQTSSWPCGSRA